MLRCKGGERIELIKDCGQWRALVLAVVNVLDVLLVLLRLLMLLLLLLSSSPFK